ncbi:MAG: cobamide remodeling phosphodiesterase CbiR [Thermodesulfobacteriota bacterium]|nr:cobamide remodeling phosphodiesterase CbiR [Thermodesulfobacteriota bacterium]
MKIKQFVFIHKESRAVKTNLSKNHFSLTRPPLLNMLSAMFSVVERDKGNYSKFSKSYRRRFPFRLATTSFIYPDRILPNAMRLAPYLDEMELILFESKNLPDREEISDLSALQNKEGLSYNVHLPLDIFLGHPSDKARAEGIAAVQEAIALTKRLTPSTYTLHYNYDETPIRLRRAKDNENNPPSPPFSKGGDMLDSPLENGESQSPPLGKDVAPSIPPLEKGDTGGFPGEKNLSLWQRHIAESTGNILKTGIKPGLISVETLNYPLTWVEDIINDLGLSVCLDLGHILLGGGDPRYYLDKYLEKTAIIHLYGVYQGRDHLGLDVLDEAALLDWLRLLKGYTGTVSIEVFSFHHLQTSLEVLEKLWKKA